jgi:hypothetical protein
MKNTTTSVGVTTADRLRTLSQTLG